MAEMEKPARRKNRMKVSQAQDEMLALLPEIEALIERVQAIDRKLEPVEPSDRLVFGRPGRESLRYGVASCANLTGMRLAEALEFARHGVNMTEAGLLASWAQKQQEEQERELERYRRHRWSHIPVAVGG